MENPSQKSAVHEIELKEVEMILTKRSMENVMKMFQIYVT